MVQALALTDSILAILEDMRVHAECTFADFFAAVVTLCSDTHVELAKPRLCKRQLDYTRCNIPAKTAETYFRVSIFIPFIDSFSQQLKDILIGHRNVFMFLTRQNRQLGLLGSIKINGNTSRNICSRFTV